ncbi:YihY/virulence factor BrkB family protein [Microbacterium oleivorans]|uniref:YihY/virulence factor BrkB family protein n=1 Tax=Microbacterium oleivorans TaxID=273677 RepID=A0A7D5IT44_9MICO|nr:YihY/virulence factor BrkB family protein [Microbacterium oleivorans]QLD11974.1 YihY/virulence factor BrkB family protein [Microbacterium oleivorans]
MPDLHAPQGAQRPGHPGRLRPSTWRYLIRRTFAGFVHDGGMDAAGSLTFFGVLAIFPAGLAVMAIIGIVGDSDEVRDQLLSILSEVAPGAVVDTADTILTNVAGSSSADVTLIISVAIAFWSSSIYVSAFGRSVNRIYGVREGRPYWKRKPIQLGLTIILLAIVMVMICLAAFSGPLVQAVGDAFGIGEGAQGVWAAVRWPAFAAAAVVLIAILYKGTGNIRLPRFGWLGLGAFLALIVMGSASVGFGLYVANFARYDEVFGAFSGVTIFLIWLFLVNVALLLGAEFNSEIERGRELQAGLPAEEHLQLPVRDAAATERRERSERITREHGRLLRRGEPLPPRPDSVVVRLRDWALRMKQRLLSPPHEN